MGPGISLEHAIRPEMTQLELIELPGGHNQPPSGYNQPPSGTYNQKVEMIYIAKLDMNYAD